MDGGRDPKEQVLVVEKDLGPLPSWKKVVSTICKDGQIAGEKIYWHIILSDKLRGRDALTGVYDDGRASSANLLVVCKVL